MKLSLITVGMNHKSYIEVLYSSLFSQITDEMQIELVYVDNCSKDGSLELIKHNFSKVVVIKNTEPLGFAENNNKGVMASRGEYIGIINPDIVFREGALGKIFDMISGHFATNAIIAPKLLNIDGSAQYSVRRFVTLNMILNRWISRENDESRNGIVSKYLYKDIDQSRTQDVDWAMGAALFMRRSIYAQLGGFDQRYYLYMEDEDLCLRAWKQRIPVIYYPEIELIHNHLRGSTHLNKKTIWHLHSLFKFFRRHGLNVERNSIVNKNLEL